ncbi:GNAT family N-acetyltransferase [Thermodesulfobacteriota bacterium]
MTAVIRMATREDVSQLSQLIRKAFSDVADRFELTIDNCPTHPSNCTDEWIRSALAKGVTYFILEEDLRPCGCVALESADSDICYLERLAVLPEYRRAGLGKSLVSHALKEASEMGALRIEIGIIAAQTELQAWYAKQGFVFNRTEHFDHLPFEVTFMFKVL